AHGLRDPLEPIPPGAADAVVDQDLDKGPALRLAVLGDPGSLVLQANGAGARLFGPAHVADRQNGPASRPPRTPGCLGRRPVSRRPLLPEGWTHRAPSSANEYVRSVPLPMMT